MNDNTSPLPRRLRRRSWVLGALAALILLAGLGYVAVQNLFTDPALWEAMAEADRLDPGWRIADLEAARPTVPDDDNSAAVVVAAGQMIGPALRSKLFNHSLQERINSVPLPQRLGDELTADLRGELTPLAEPLKAARQLAGRPHGRYTLTWSADAVGTPMPHLELVRSLNALLAFDAVARAQEGNLAGALDSCRAALNAGRSVGDEPAAVSQFVRRYCDRVAVQSLERTLAQGEVAAAALESFQRLLEDEADQPLELRMARAERADIHQYLQVVRAGKFDRAAYGLASSMLGPQADDLLDRARARGCHAKYLHYLTELVEIAKLPPEQQQHRLRDLQRPAMRVPVLLNAFAGNEDHRAHAAAFHAGLAQLRCAAAALSAERYRLETGRWPDGLEVLVPRYLKAVPTDPFDGQALRLRRLPDGVMIYSVGKDGRDDGGTLDRSDRPAPGTDVGFQLWDAAQRRQP